MRYLFPFKFVRQGSRIVIYGSGQVGQEYLWQVRETRYAEVVCLADARPERYEALNVVVKPLSELKAMDFDFVIVAIHSLRYAQDAIGSLQAIGIPKKKIVYRREMVPEFDVVRDRQGFVDEDSLAFSKSNCLPIAVSASGGLGDLVVYKRLLEEILRWDKNIIVDVFVRLGQKKFMWNLLSKTKEINCIVDNLEQYKAVKDRYAVAFRFGLDLDLDVCHFEFLQQNPRLVRTMKAMDAAKDTYGRDFVGILSAVHYARCRKDGLTRYTAYNRYPGFDVTDWRTEIPLDEEQGRQFQHDFGDMPYYITINYGWDKPIGCDGKQPQAKVWPFSNWEKMVELLRRKIPQLKIVQTGAQGFPRVPGCDKYVLGKPLSYVAWLLKGARMHIDIEGGLVHLASQLGTKCAVLFGPTPMDYYAYPCNFNIRADSCSDCYWLVNDFTSCYRGLECPECMAAITPEVVLERIIAYLKKIPV